MYLARVDQQGRPRLLDKVLQVAGNGEPRRVRDCGDGDRVLPGEIDDVLGAIAVPHRPERGDAALAQLSDQAIDKSPGRFYAVLRGPLDTVELWDVKVRNDAKRCVRAPTLPGLAMAFSGTGSPRNMSGMYT
jgi:hypothetical protein